MKRVNVFRSQGLTVRFVCFLSVLFAAGTLFAAGPASAAAQKSPTPSASGSAVAPDNSSVTITDQQSSGGITPMSVVNVGGGTWQYGSYLGTYNPKTCYSYYVHNQKYHSSTVIIANGNDKQYGNATYWSNASAWAGAAYTCYVYYSTY